MKDYLKYFLKTPLRFSWMLIPFTVAFAIIYNVISNINEGSANWIDVGVTIFAIAMVTLTILQPYKEYKDGLK